MTWRITSWSPRSRTGTVSAPAIAELPFGPAENTYNAELEVGTEVLVALDRDDGNWILRSLMPRRAAQPPRTEAAEFSAVNRLGHGDLVVEHRDDQSITFLGYDCCSWCAPVSRICFEGATEVVGLDDDMDLSAPLFRKASAEEARVLRVPVGHTAYCIVTNHGNGVDGPKLFVVARAVRVELGAHVRVGC